MLTIIERRGFDCLGERPLFSARPAQQRNNLYHSEYLKERQHGY
jgi:hypothetical protein